MSNELLVTVVHVKMKLGDNALIQKYTRSQSPGQKTYQHTQVFDSVTKSLQSDKMRRFFIDFMLWFMLRLTLMTKRQRNVPSVENVLFLSTGIAHVTSGTNHRYVGSVFALKNGWKETICFVFSSYISSIIFKATLKCNRLLQLKIF